jgi:hypothetical protein
MAENRIAYLAGVVGDYVLAFVRAFLGQLFSWRVDTPTGTAIDADFWIIDQAVTFRTTKDLNWLFQHRRNWLSKKQTADQMC